MKIIKALFILVLLVLIGGFGYFAFVDVPVKQETVSKTIPNDRLFD